MTGVPKTRGAATIILLAVLGWPLIEVAGGTLMDHQSPYQVVALRYAAHLTLLLPLAFLRSGTGLFRTGRPLLQLLRGFVMFLMPLVFVAGSSSGGAAWVWSAFWSVIVLALLGALLLGERPVASAWAVGGVAFVGSWFARGSPTGSVRAAGAGIVSAACFAGYLVLSRVLREEDLGTSLLYTAVGALVPTLLLAAPVWVALSAADLLPTLALGTLSLLILGSLDLSLEHATLSRVAPWLVAIPALEVVAAFALDGTIPGRRALFGCCLILAAIGLWAARSEGAFPFRRPLRELGGAP